MTLLLTYLGFLIAGLAGSLHCIGMCGPILVALTGGVREAEVTVGGRRVRQTAQRAAAELLWYHAGRISTYAMLGAIAGLVGSQIRDAIWLGQIQNWLGLAVGGAAVGLGLVLLVAPAFECGSLVDRSSGNGVLGRVFAFLYGLAQLNTRSSRFLLGAIMGFVPCGLVYIMLTVVAVTGHPLTAALGMIAFGLGTLPALTGIVLAVGFIPVGWRRHGHRAAIVVALIVGSVFIWRSWPMHSMGTGHDGLDARACPLCADDGGELSSEPEP